MHMSSCEFNKGDMYIRDLRNTECVALPPLVLHFSSR